MKLYAENKNGDTYILSQDVEKDAIQAQMIIEFYIEEIKRLNRSEERRVGKEC